LGRSGKADQAITIFRQVVKLAPGSAEAHTNLGISLADHYDVPSALDEFTEAVRLAPASAAAHYNRGKVFLDQRRFKDANAELKTAANLDSHYADTLYLLAVTEKELGNVDRSRTLAEQAVQIDPQNAQAFYLLGQNLKTQGHQQEAIAAWKEAVRLDPQRTEVLYNLARVLDETDAKTAQHYRLLLRQQLDRAHARSEAETLGNFGLAAAKAHDYAQAISQLQKAINVCGDCSAGSDLHKDLGLIECQSGDLESAERELRLALQMKGHDLDIDAALDVIKSYHAQHADVRR
jgi:tetratricopeptide (TPR) repeat protein